MNDDDEDLRPEILVDFLLQRHKQNLLELLARVDEPITNNYLFPLDVQELADYEPILAETLYRKPFITIRVLEQAIVLAQEDIMSGEKGAKTDFSVKDKVKTRLKNSRIRGTIHLLMIGDPGTGMEQQSVSVAKAGLLTGLNTRTTVIATCNPKGHYDPHLPLAKNTSLPNSLLSRFDMILILRDFNADDWNAELADHVMHADGDMEDERKREDEKENKQIGQVWDLPTLKQYISWVRSNFEPYLSKEAESALVRYYQLLRRCPHADPSRVSVRMLESLIRISQAHARFLARDIVTLYDACNAIRLVDASMVLGSALLDHNPIADKGVDVEDIESLVLDRLASREGASTWEV